MKLVPRVDRPSGIRSRPWWPPSVTSAQGTNSTGSWPLEHPVIAMIGWCALIIGVCVPLALRRFRTVNA